MFSFKKISVLFFSVLACGMLNQCKEVDDGTIEAAIHAISGCNTTINYMGRDVYGYRGDAFLFVSSVQAGGHDGNKDLGVNIFGLTSGTYTITSGGDQPGTAYVYFRPNGDGSNEFISKLGQGTMDVDLELVDDGTGFMEVYSVMVEFSNVEMINLLTGKDTCIGSFSLEAER